MNARERDELREYLRSIPPEQIEELRQAGRLDHVLGIPADETRAISRARACDTLTLDDVRALNRRGMHDLIADADRAGRIRKDTPR